jgi:protein O-GlcNAcase/histone acetyltransferase
MTEQVSGYAEGYYGRLLTWQERRTLVKTLSANGQSTYYYAPKEDVLHRWQWRTAYSDLWLEEFASFCRYARKHGVSVVAGVAPGLDFNFEQLPKGSDYHLLSIKSRALRDAGADHLSLLLDDIDEDFHTRRGKFLSEGQAHATLANSLSDELGCPIWVTPRVYADELIVSDKAYLSDLFDTLQSWHTVLYCGSDVVAKDLSQHSLGALAQKKISIPSKPKSEAHRLILWDNLYANDYCPRRLFIGPWHGRQNISNVLLNPTGMINTDVLLLDLMAAQVGLEDHSFEATSVWRNVLTKHGVPDEFFEIAQYFYHPVFNNQVEADLPAPSITTFNAIEHCLWRWKTPLAREWYGYIFGLKHDLLSEQQQLPQDRIRKTQTVPLAKTLLSRV